MKSKIDFSKILIFLNKGSARSVKVKKHIIGSIFVKGASIVIGFLLVRVTLDYLDPTKYGIWLTLSSFLTWFSFFEIGLGNGLRNKLGETLAVKDYKLGKIYVSTTYAILAIIISIIAVLFLIANAFINWTVLLNTDKTLAHELSVLALIVFGFFFLRFVVKLISVVLYADQRPAIANSFGPIGNLFALVVIFILTKTTNGSLIYLGWTLSLLPIIVLIIASVYFYSGKYKHISPSFRFVKFKYAKDLLNLGVKFFFIQIAGLVIYQSSNIIIIQFFGPAEVTIYNIAYKYFSILSMGFAIVTMPFWSAFTEAWVLKDIKWIKSAIKKNLYVWALFSMGGIFLLIFSTPLYHLWIGDIVQIPLELSLSLLIYFITFTFGGIFTMFINGIGKIKLQMYGSMAGILLFISSAFFFVKVLNFGIAGIVIASIIGNFNGVLLTPLQFVKIINNNAKGIWNS